MQPTPVRAGAGEETRSGECYPRFFEIQSFILTLNTSKTTDAISQVNYLSSVSRPVFGSGFKPQAESFAATSWPPVAWVEVSESVFLLEMTVESGLLAAKNLLSTLALIIPTRQLHPSSGNSGLNRGRHKRH